MSANASVSLKFTDEKELTTILSALTPEADSFPTRRAEVKFEIDDLALSLTVKAEDTVALRATLNAYLRWINSIINVILAIESD